MEMFHTHVSEESKRLVMETLSSGRLSEGERVKEFENELSRLGLSDPVTVNSGTSALHLALTLVGVGPNNEVILPPQTFVATGMAVLMCGATPVFADIDPHTGNICPNSIAKKITRRTKVIFPVHWLGLSCEMEAIHHVVLPDDVHVVEDAAHALGGVYQGRKIGDGEWSSFSCFSFQASKPLTTSDGGCLCSRSSDPYPARSRRWFGINRNDTIGELGERNFSLEEVGFKYHMSDVAASIGIGNAKTFPQRLKRRQEIGQIFRQEFEGCKDVDLLSLPSYCQHAYYAFGIKVNRREDFIKKMKEKGIPCSIICSRIDKNPIFGGLRSELMGQNEFDQNQINLPCHESLEEKDIQQIIDAVQGGW